VRWLIGRFGRTASPGAGYGAGNSYNYAGPGAGPQAGPGFGGIGSGAGRQTSEASRRAGNRDEIGIGDADLQVFEQRLKQLQDAYSREDYDALRRISTPEVMSYLSEELAQARHRGCATRCSTSIC
jgi:predicted lipid-binding transport protein (Tim44 family)